MFWVPRLSSYPLLGPKYPLLETMHPQLRVQGGSWFRVSQGTLHPGPSCICTSMLKERAENIRRRFMAVSHIVQEELIAHWWG